MNKTMKVILLTLIGAGCFGAGLYYSVIEFEQQVKKWDSKYQIITEKVYAFEKVSDPKTIRRYVNDLNKILDDIDFLHTLIESGQLADESLTRMFGSQDNLSSKIDSLYSEISLSLSVIKDYNIAQDVVDERTKVSINSVNKSIDKQQKYIEEFNNQLNQLQMTLDKVNKDIQVVKESKYGQKIWR